MRVTGSCFLFPVGPWCESRSEPFMAEAGKTALPTRTKPQLRGLRSIADGQIATHFLMTAFNSSRLSIMKFRPTAGAGRRYLVRV